MDVSLERGGSSGRDSLSDVTIDAKFS